MFSFSTFAGNSIPPFENFLKHEITYPEFAKESSSEGIVLVCFSIDENGKITVKESNSDNESLRTYVTDKLNNMILPFMGQQEDEINMKFVFKLF
jgi:hypothetical protein